MSELPPESEKLLAVVPEDFVAERQRLAARLREEGRSEEAAAVAGLRKPSAVVLAVNRAARDRPKAARAAAEAAERVEKAQASGDLDAFRAAVRELDDAFDLLSEVGVAHVSPGKKATDAMRRRVHELLRRAVASEDTRAALARGALLEEQDAAGFAPLSTMVAKPQKRKDSPATHGDPRAKRREEERRKRAKALRDELASAEEKLKAAVRAADAAEREKAKAEREVASIRAKLDRLNGGRRRF